MIELLLNLIALTIFVTLSLWTVVDLSQVKRRVRQLEQVNEDLRQEYRDLDNEVPR